VETRLWPTVDHLDPPDLPRHGCNSDRGPAASGGPTVLANDRNGGRLRLNASRHDDDDDDADNTGLSFSCCCLRNLRNSMNIRNYRSSSSSKVVDLGANRKCICNFLSVINSNFGRISYRFLDIDAFSSKIACFSHPNLV